MGSALVTPEQALRVTLGPPGQALRAVYLSPGQALRASSVTPGHALLCVSAAVAVSDLDMYREHVSDNNKCHIICYNFYKGQNRILAFIYVLVTTQWPTALYSTIAHVYNLNGTYKEQYIIEEIYVREHNAIITILLRKTV